MKNGLKKTSGALRTLLKISLVLVVLVVIALIILSNIGGNGDGYKNAVEGFLSDFTGLDARVETLNGMTFYPNISFEFENATFHENPETEIALAQLKKARVSVGFWDMTFQNGKFKDVYIEGLDVKEGLLTKDTLNVDLVDLQPGPEDSAALMATGTLGDEPFDAVVNLKVEGRAPSQSYYFTTTRPFAVLLGDAILTGIFKDEDDALRVEYINLTYQDRDVFKGGMEIDERARGVLNFEDYGSALGFDLSIEDTEAGIDVGGMIKSPCFRLADFADGYRFSNALYYIYDLLFRDDAALSSLDLKDVSLQISPVCQPGIKPADVTLPFGFEDQIQIDIQE